MGDSNQEPDGDGSVKYGHTLPREEAAAYLSAIAAGLGKGAVELKQAEGGLRMELPDNVKIKVSASRKGKKAKIRFELAWREEGPELEIT
jgi:amphi-Trp domain-containing protein